MYTPVPPDFDLPAVERRILAFWEETRAFDKLREQLAHSDKQYSFIDGPITANGDMGVHHAWGRTYKDAFQRYRAMTGHRQRYQNGFDCQGLWVEVGVEKELGFDNKHDIEAYGIGEFVRRCKERVLRYARIQTEQSIRLGYWMDWGNSYYTMSDENNYTIWGMLATCFRRGWLYQGHDVMPWCPRCGTGISQHEIDTEGYSDVTHTSVYVRFPLLDRPGESLLAWTTTPWTLSSNVAAAVHPELTYARATNGTETVVLAEALVPLLGEGWDVVQHLRGEEMVGWRYRGPFDELPAQRGVEHRVIPWTEVSQEEGTGIVHIAPGCGEEDYQLGKEFGLPAIAPIDENGVYVDGFGWLTGRHVQTVAPDVVDDLRKKGVLFRAQAYTHRYPHCWRCGTELVFRLVDEWYIHMDELRPMLMDVARQIRWIPDFGLDREIDWLRNMHDWMISKKRYWGLALPIWVCQACGEFDVIGSRSELQERAVEGWETFEGHSPHRPWIDAVKLACSRCGGISSRIQDVGNPWLDAGIVPYSTLGYGTDPSYWEQWFPGDFITESFPGQYRNWFYSLLVMSTVLENRPPFRTVLGFGTLRSEDGRPMHKSWGNAIEFNEGAERAGADVMRWIFSTQNPTANLSFGWKLADETKRRLLTLWNSYRFFVEYARLEEWQPNATAPEPAERTLIDRWLLARMQNLVERVRQGLDEFDAMNASRAIEAFFDDLSNWYIRRNRARFWAPGSKADPAALATLYEALTTLVRLLAPFLPFMAEEMYQNLVRSVQPEAPESVHHCAFPDVQEDLRDDVLVAQMAQVRRIVSLGHAARKQASIPVRRPLPAVRISGVDSADLPDALRGEIANELNAKDVHLEASLSEAVRQHVETNPRILGPKYGKAYPALRKELQEGRFVVEEDGRVRVGDVVLELDEVTVSVEPAEGFAAAVDRELTVVLDTQLTPELIAEGRARDVVRLIQEARKTAGLDVADRIDVTYQAPADLSAVFKEHAETIKRETLALSLEPDGVDGAESSASEVDGMPVRLAVRRSTR